MSEYTEAVMVYDNQNNGNIPVAELVSGNKEEEEKLRKIELYIKDRNKEIIDIENKCNEITKKIHDLQVVYTSNRNKMSNMYTKKRKLGYRDEILNTKIFRYRSDLKKKQKEIFCNEVKYAKLFDIEPKYSSQEEIENEPIIKLKKLISGDKKEGLKDIETIQYSVDRE